MVRLTRILARPAAATNGDDPPTQSPTLGLSHLQFEAMLTAARLSSNDNDFALVCLLGLLGLRIFEATSPDVSDLGKEHAHRVLRVVGKGHKIVLVPMPPAIGRAIDRAIGERATGPILRNQHGARMDRHAATRRPHRLQKAGGVRIARMHPHMFRRTSDSEFAAAWVTRRGSKDSPGIASIAAWSPSSRCALPSGVPRTARRMSARQAALRWALSSAKDPTMGPGPRSCAADS